jgi:cytochrome d ubiquinol oxidase subunit II
MSLAYLLLSILWFSLIAYAVTGGADFGAGVWDLFAFGTNEQRQRQLIDKALGPVWETNHVWLVFLVVGLFSAFPTAFSALCIVLFIPLTLALIGIVLRGSAFVFRTHGLRPGKPALAIWTRVFSFSSVMTPFFLAVSAAAVASGRFRIQQDQLQTDTGSLWLTPFALTVGGMAITLCATLAAIYLTVEATNENDRELAEAFRIRGLLAGALTALLGALGLFLSVTQAPLLWQGMLDHGMPLTIITMLVGLATAITLWYRRYHLARFLVVIEATFLLGSWGVSQMPYLIPPDLTIEAAAGAPSTLLLLLVGIIFGMIIILPSIYYLFYVFKFKNSARSLEQA